MLEKMFKLKENNTTAKTEVIAGITTFMTMAYILAVNPNLLSQAGMDPTAVLIATCLASFIGTFAMALLANYPFALAPGMGLNAYFAFTVCGNMGYSWKVALMAVFFEGIIFIILSLTNVREAIFNAIPTTLKKGVSAGIGLFIAFIGLQGGHIVVNNDTTLLSYVNFRDNWQYRRNLCSTCTDRSASYCNFIHQKSQGIYSDRYSGYLDSWNDLSGSGCLPYRCRRWILFSVSDICHD